MIILKHFLTLMLFACLKLSASPSRAGYQESPALAMKRTELVTHIHYHADIWNNEINEMMRYINSFKLGRCF